MKNKENSYSTGMIMNVWGGVSGNQANNSGYSSSSSSSGSGGIGTSSSKPNLPPLKDSNKFSSWALHKNIFD